MKNYILALALFLSCFWIFHFLFQNPSVYKYTLNKVSRNWVNHANKRQLADTTYLSLTNANYLQWDGKHYSFIKENGYDVKKAHGEHIFAFFPLFPFLWKISYLPSIGIIFLNFLLFAVGLIILRLSLSQWPKSFTSACIPLLFPGIISFLLPYTEATFFVTISIALYGYIKNKYWIYFVGMLLASMTRPSITLIAAAMLCTEVYFLFQHRNIVATLKSFFQKISPLIIGTLLISLLQLYYGSGSLLKFMEVQSLWGKKLSMPHDLKDWSLEGFSMNFATIIFVAIPVITSLLLYFPKIFEKKIELIENKVEYIQFLSFFFLTGTFLYILLYQGGSLNGLFRYVQCTPFFFALLFSIHDKLAEYNKQVKIFIFLICSLTGLLFMGLIPYSTNWSFSDTGFFLFSLSIFLWLFQQEKQSLYYKILVFITFFANAIWTTYLFNTYISNAWIFT